MKKSIQKLEDYWKSAEKAQGEGKYSFAESIWYAAYEEAQELPRTDRRRALVMERLCECLWYQQKFEDAVPLAFDLVQIYTEVLGPEHIDTGCMVANQALLFHVMKDYKRAEPLLAKAYVIKRKHLGDIHPEVVRLETTLKDVRTALGINGSAPVVTAKQWGKTGRFEAMKLPTTPAVSPDEAVKRWKSALDKARGFTDQCQWSFGEQALIEALGLLDSVKMEDEKLWNTLTLLVDVQSKQDKYLPAAANAVRKHNLLVKKEGKPTKATADSLNDLARLFYYGRDLEAAQKYAELCTKEYEKLFGEDDPSVATCLVNLALLLHLQKKYAETENAYKRALNIRTKKLGAEHNLTNQVLNKYSDLLKEMHRDEEAEHMKACASGFVTGSWKVVELAPEENLTSY